MTLRDRLLAVLLPTIWGFNFVVLEWGLGSESDPQSERIPPLLFVAIRFLFVVFPAILFVRKPDVPLSKLLLIGSFTLGGQYGLLYTSMALGMPAGLASLVLQVQVPLTIVLAATVLRETPTTAQIVGVTIGAIGMVVVGAGRGGHITAVALVLCLAAGLSWAIGNALTRALRVSGGFNLTIWSSLVVPLPMILLAVVVEGPHGVADGLEAFGWKAGVSTAYTVLVSTMLGFAIFNGLLARYPSSSVVPWILIVPVVGILTAWLCLGETPNAAELVGGAGVILGVCIAQGLLRRRGQRV
ncbi:EamA family transporter [Nocardioides sp. Kera G14]|uniref:EamA family transporter n=1 Tax=Nocardioides sp. Kera G14 TaxID=2884264 RepID=UPI001D12153A|nr:EamA family transporter [Nocardioides sp. Kera G14]UDY24347.1 EamA family transporter [Nocardioides sp. Kera G14]